MRSLAVFAFLVASIGSAVQEEDGQECGHSEPQKIDWKSMERVKFYLDEAVHDPATEMVVCYANHDWKKVGDRVEFLVEDYRVENKALTRGQVKVHYIFHPETGGYSMTARDVESFKEEVDHGATEKQIHDLDDEMPQIVDHETFMFTDYENYMILTMCGDDDKRFLWIFYTTNHPSEEQYKMVGKRLDEIGGGWNKVERVKTGCTKVECYKGYEKYEKDFAERRPCESDQKEEL